jgi:hypothetical protein
VDLQADVFLKEGPTETLVGQGELLNQSTAQRLQQREPHDHSAGPHGGSVPVPSGAQLD